MNRTIETPAPVAETYDALQGLSCIREAWSGGSYEADERYLRSRLQCIDLLWLNMLQLTERLETSISRERWDDAAEQSIWLSDIGAIAHTISRTCRADYHVMRGADTPSISPMQSQALHHLVEQFGRLDRDALPVLEHHRDAFARAIRSGGPTNPMAAIAERLKVFFRNVQVTLENIARLVLPAREADYQDFISARVLLTAFREPWMSGETYFTQFRLLHQIPELLGLDALATCDRLRDNPETDHIAAIRDLAILTDISETALLCLGPLVMDLFPASYYRIRNNLGLTSGSHSVTLSKQLFSQRFFELSEQFAALASNPATASDPAARLALEFWRRYHANVYAWRAAHAHLPRNVLGGPGTRSLIGSPDAMSIVEKMRLGIAKKDAFEPPLWENISQDVVGVFASFAKNLNVDRWLIAITGETAQAAFPDVQQRSGRFEGRRPD